MSMKQRAEEYNRRQAETRGKERADQPPRAIELFNPTPAWGIVDSEVVEVQGLVDEPGMSLAAICSKIGAGTVPVSISEVQIFRALTQEAVQSILEGQRSQQGERATAGSGSSSRR